MRKKLNIIKYILFLILLVPAIIIIGKKFEEASKYNVVNAFTRQRFEDFYALTNNTLDMVFVGSSHSYCTFDPDVFDNELNISSFQMGTPLQYAYTTYYELLEIFKTQSPRVVVYETYFGVLESPFEPKQADALFQVLKESSLKDDYIKEVFPFNERLKYYYKPTRYQQDYMQWKSKDIAHNVESYFEVYKKLKAKNGTEEYRSKGFVDCDIIIPEDEYDRTNQFKNRDGANFKLDPTQIFYLKRIKELCEEQNAHLVFVTAPIANVSMDWIKNYDKINQVITEIAQEMNVPYIDYNIINQDEKLLENHHFRDDAHLNSSGAFIISKHFSNWLKANIDAFNSL